MRSLHTTNQQDHKNNTPYRVIHQHRTKLGNPIRGIIVPTSIIPIIIITLLSLFSVSLANIIGSGATYAEGGSVSLSIDNSDTVLELTVPSSVSLDLTPNSANDGIAFGYTDLAVSAGTNNPAGYILTMSVPSPNLANSTYIIPTLASGATYTETTFTTNAWGYKLSTGSTYSGIPSTGITLVPEGTAGNATTTTLNLAAKVDSTTPAGTYTTTLNFAVTAIVPPFGGITTMQEMTPAICSAAAENDTIQLKDTRDNKIYWASKLKDGHCWMTQNLDYDIKASDNEVAVIGGTTTTWNSSYSPTATSTTLTSNSSYTGTASWDPGDYYVVDGGKNVSTACDTWRPSSTCQGTTKLSYDLTSSSAQGKTELHYHLGNYYQWNAATAGYGGTKTNQDITQSICPKGWRLPTSNSYANNYSFGKLTNAYGITNSATGSSDANLIKSPLWFVRAGYVYDGSLYAQGTRGYVWSSRADSSYASVAYFLSFSPPGVNPSNNGYRGSGHSVRCVAE